MSKGICLWTAACVFAVLLWGCAGVPMTHRPSDEPSAAAVPRLRDEGVARASPGPAAQSAAPAPAPVLTAPAAAPQPDISLGGSTPPLTQALDQALQKLAETHLANEKLKETVTTLERQLAERDKELADLKQQMAAYDSRIQEMEVALDKWKADVLGFRDEMRDYEEAQIEALQEVLVLLRGFEKKASGQP